MKVGEKVVTLSKVRMIVLKFHKNRFSDDIIPDIFGCIAKGENSVAKGNLTRSTAVLSLW